MNHLEKEIGGYVDNFYKELEVKKYKKIAKMKSLKELKKQFIVFAEQTIQPCMEKFKIVLEKRNQSCVIELKPSDTEDGLPSIVLQVFPSYERNFTINSYPQISFHVKKSLKICVHAQKCMPSSKGGFEFKEDFDIDEITSKFVEEQITDLIKDCYNTN